MEPWDRQRIEGSTLARSMMIVVLLLANVGLRRLFTVAGSEPGALARTDLLDGVTFGAVAVILFIKDALEAPKRLRRSASLRRLNALLERRFERRTAELVQTNDALSRETAERERIERRLVEQSTHDPLTGHVNRRRFLSLVEMELARKTHELRAVFFIDIDHFKLINDGLGHAIGDRVLVAVGERLRRVLGPDILVGRVGGDEFAALSRLALPEDAETLAERVVAAMKNPIAVGDRLIYCSASIGVRYVDNTTESAASYLRDAHTAMHHAKSLGRSRHVVFDAHMRTDAETKFALAGDLRDAVERDEFFVEYQPVIELNHGTISGFEALVRWAHPDRGVVSPGVFIPTAEDNGLVVRIGRAVLRSVCREIVRRNISVDTPIGVNVSAVQLFAGDFVEEVTRTLAEFSIAPASIMLEVTESVFVENLNAARDVLLRLKQLGVLIAIDDFGTGYSSLSYIGTLPFDVLKIDQAFVRNIDSDTASRDIVRMLLVLATSLNMTVIAEGIETPTQLSLLRNAGCEYGQGFLFARPRLADDAFGELGNTHAHAMTGSGSTER